MTPSRTLLTSVLLGAVLLSGCGTTVPVGQVDRAATGLGGPTPGSSSAATDPGGGDSVGGGSGTSGGDVGTSAGSAGASSSGGSTATGTTTTGAAAAGGSSSGATGAAAAVPGIATKGRGWDATHVYIGVPTADDANAATAALGGNFDNGSFEKDVNGVLAQINSAGGLFGRRVVGVFYDTPITKAQGDPAGTAQAICTYFTQDRPVIAVLSTAPQFDTNESFHHCLEHDKVTMISGTTDYSTADYARLGPHLWSAESLSTDILVPSWIAALKRQGYFQGWNTTTSSPSSTPAKVGVLLPDDPQGHHVAGLLAIALKKADAPLTSSFFYDPAGNGKNSQAEVLQFRSANVTHLLDLPPVELEVALFQSAAEQQHYRPRHGYTSFDLPVTVEENTTIDPAAQQIGSMGIGWLPINDTSARNDPGPTPGRKRCLDAIARGGQSFSSAQRRAAFIAYGFCDRLYMIRDAVLAGKGFDGAAFLRGMPLIKTITAGTFGSSLSVDNHGFPAFYRDQQYQKACSCFVYVGGNRPFSG